MKFLFERFFDGEFEHSQLFTNLWAKNGDKLVKKWEWVPPSRISTTNKIFDREPDSQGRSWLERMAENRFIWEVKSYNAESLQKAL
jgi:hypothetical protein